MELIPNDLQLSIYREIHRSVLSDVFNELFYKYKWNDDPTWPCYLENRKTHTMFGWKIYNWRPCGIYGFIYNNKEDHIATMHDIPARYWFSNGIDLILCLDGNESSSEYSESQLEEDD